MDRRELPRSVRPQVAGLMILVLAGWMSGCSTTHPVTAADHHALFDEIKRQTADGEARLELKDGQALKATMIHGDVDTLHFTDPEFRTQERVPTAAVRRIVMVSHGRGAGQGLGIGALSGAGLGAMAGFADGDDPPGFMSFSAGAKAGMGAVGGALVGGVIGLAAGAASGSRTVYEFEGVSLDGEPDVTLVRNH